MSNHVSAINTQTILIKWSNGIRTLIPCPTYDANRLAKNILNKLPLWIKERDETIQEEFDSTCGYPCCIVWNLESLLNYTYGLSMLFLYPEDVFSHPSVLISISEPYDVGETETIEDIKNIYPDYKYPYTLKIN